jgi:DNA polymerase
VSTELATIAEQAAHCEACDLYAHATQTVFGEGPAPTRIMVVGEQPGDREDRAGHPFVGPAGRVLDEALEAAGIDRTRVYVTNAVKHFKWKPQGKRRIHQKPDAEEVEACSRWLDHEVDLVKPEIVVAMGVTAVRAVLGSREAISRLRGQLHASRWGVQTVVTIHPSAVLRVREPEQRDAQLGVLVEDLRLAADVNR